MSRIPLALLPGTLCTAALWDAQVASLGDIADVTIIESSKHDNLDELAKHVHQVMPPRFAVAGLSYGGIAALAVWRHNPQSVSHLGLLNTTPLPVTPEKRAAQEQMVETARSGGFEQMIAEHATAFVALAAHLDDPALYEKIIAMAKEVGVDGFANQVAVQVNRPDSRQILRDIACPTLVIGGENDTLCMPEVHRMMAQVIPNNLLHIFEKCGHLSSLERPVQVSNAMREWLLM